MDRDAARTEALGAIKRVASEQGLGESIVIKERVVETLDAWYFPYVSAGFVLDGPSRQP